MTFWTGKNVCVTGGAGFVGSYLTEQLVAAGARVTVAESPACHTARIASVKDEVALVCGDLQLADTADRATAGQDVVMHLAGKVASIQYNRTHHAEMFSTNMQLAVQVMQAAARNGAGRFLVVSSGVVYPETTDAPIDEDQAEGAAPEDPNAGYGWAKRMSERLGAFYHQESSMKVAVCRPFNIYGPRDHWDERISHVIPALIKRIVDGEDPVKVWGSGNQIRSFLHAADAATAMRLIVEKAQGPEPINVAHPREVSIRELTYLIMQAAGCRPRIEFDTSKPDGHPRRTAALSRLQQVTGWLPQISLQEGLGQTVEEYRNLCVAS